MINCATTDSSSAFHRKGIAAFRQYSGSISAVFRQVFRHYLSRQHLGLKHRLGPIYLSNVVFSANSKIIWSADDPCFSHSVTLLVTSILLPVHVVQISSKSPTHPYSSQKPVQIQPLPMTCGKVRYKYATSMLPRSSPKCSLMLQITQLNPLNALHQMTISCPHDFKGRRR